MSRVAQALHVEEADRFPVDRERSPVPGAAVQHERLERVQVECADGVAVRRVGEVELCRRDGEDRVAVERHERLCVRVVAIHDLAPCAALGVRHFVVAVTDHVEMRIGPIEVKRVATIGRVGVGNR